MGRTFSYFPAYVISLTRLTPHMRRLVIGGAGAAGWRPVGAPDEAVLLVLPRPDGAVIMPDAIGTGDPYAYTRWYTVRRYDAQRDELTLDIADHEEGLSVRWMRAAAPGDPVGVSSASSWWNRPADATWQVLLGDLTALPAISRALEECGDGLLTQAAIEIPGSADELPVETPREICWLHTPPGEPSQLQAFARSLCLPPGPGYVYSAGESLAARAVRKHLRHERGLPGRSYSVSGYWRHRSEEWMRRFQAAQAQLGLAELYAQFEAADADKEALTDELDRRLDAAGL